MRPLNSRILPFLFLAAQLFAQAPPSTAGGVGDLLVAPTRLVFEGRRRSAELNLSNIGATRATYRVSLIRMEMDEQGAFQERPLDPGTEGTQSLYRFSPREVTLGPQESQTVRIQVRKPAELPAGEYRLHLVFRAVPTVADPADPIESPRPLPVKVEAPKAPPVKAEEPKRVPAKADLPKPTTAKADAPRLGKSRKPAGPAPVEPPAAPVPPPAPVPDKEEAPRGVSIRLTPVYGIAIPLIVRHGDTAAKVVLSEPRLGEGARSLRFRLERSGNQSVYGDLQATLLPPGGPPVLLAEIAGLAVYTPNPSRTVTMALPPSPALPPGSRIRITFAAPAQDGGALFAEAFLPVP